jgi:hypothetical protein
MWEQLAGQALSAITGTIGANQAANAQENAAKQSAQTAYRNQLAQLQLQEPNRYTGYQALADLNSLYGYQTSPYSTIGQLQNTMTKLGAGEIKQALKSGASFDQLQQMGTVGDVSGKQYKKLSKYLTPEQIQTLRMGPAQAATAPGAGSTGNTGQAGNMSRFFASPDYQFRRDEGIRGIEQGAAARGGALSGNALRGVSAFNSNLASQEFGSYINRLMDMAGLGTAATANVGNAMNANAGAQMGAQQQIGDARASGIMGTTNSIANAVGGAADAITLNRYLNPRPAWTPFSNPGRGYSGVNPANYRIGPVKNDLGWLTGG